MTYPRDESKCCSAVKADGARCRAYAVHGTDLCAGHLGLGLVRDPSGAGRKGSVKSAQVRAERAEIRKRGLKQRLADAAERELIDSILSAYERGIKSDDPAVAVRAADSLLNRVLGKPKETIEQVSERPDELRKLAELTVEERDALWRQLTADGLFDPDATVADVVGDPRGQFVA